MVVILNLVLIAVLQKNFSILRINKVDFKNSQYVSEIMQLSTTQDRKIVNNWYRSKYSQHQKS